MGVNKKQWLFNQIIAADPTKNTEDVFNSDVEELYNSMGLQGIKGIAPSVTYATRNTINITDYPYYAVPDNSTDNTTVIQNAINYAAANNIRFVRIPPASLPYVFTYLTVPGGVILIGDGYECKPNTNYGDPQWLATGNLTGSVLRTMALSGTAINFTGGSNSYRLRSFLLVGPGTGTAMGIAFGTGSTYSTHNDVQDVLVCNLTTAWDLSGSEDSTYIHPRSRACKTGFQYGNAFNQNVILNAEIQFSSVDGIHSIQGSANQWLGGLLQNTTGGTSIRHTAGEANTYQGFYHESASAPSNLILIEGGSQNVFRDWWISNPGGQITIAGGGTNKLENIRAASPGAIVITASNPQILNDVAYSTLSGSGAGLARIFDGNTGLSLGNAGKDLRVPTGSKYYFETVGTGSYIARDPANGDTIVSSGSSVVKLPTTVAHKTGQSVTASRPSAATVGQGAQYFDTTLNKPIWSDGTNWKDASGTVV